MLPLGHCDTRVKWRHSNLWSRYDYHGVGHNVVLWAVGTCNWWRFVALIKQNRISRFKKSWVLTPASDIKVTQLKVFTLPCPTSWQPEQLAYTDGNEEITSLLLYAYGVYFICKASNALWTLMWPTNKTFSDHDSSKESVGLRRLSGKVKYASICIARFTAMPQMRSDMDHTVLPANYTTPAGSDREGRRPNNKRRWRGTNIETETLRLENLQILKFVLKTYNKILVLSSGPGRGHRLSGLDILTSLIWHQRIFKTGEAMRLFLHWVHGLIVATAFVHSDFSKDFSLKARIKDWNFVLIDNQWSKPRTTSLVMRIV